MIEESLSAAGPVFRALGEPSRLNIVVALVSRGGSASVTELQEDLGVPQSSVSRHLRVLLDAHLLNVIRRGNQRIYELQVHTEQLDAVSQLVNRVRACQHDEN